MAQIPIDFSWQVALDGYRWLEDATAVVPHTDDPRVRPPFLSDGRVVGLESYRTRRYRPLEEFTGLFRVFAATPATRQCIKVFADRFGSLLGPTETTGIRLLGADRKHADALGAGEPLSAWVREILAMREVVALMDAVSTGDADALGQWMRWSEDGDAISLHLKPELTKEERVAGVHRESATGIGRTTTDRLLLASIARGDLIQPARHFIERRVNEHLNGRATARLLWDEARNAHRVHIIPEGLVGALWLQCAAAVESGSDFRTCAECGLWFELSPQTARLDKTYCSDACRIRAYRKRQSDVALLKLEGHAPREIAKRLGLEVETVRTWIAKGVKVRTGRRGRPPKKNG